MAAPNSPSRTAAWGKGRTLLFSFIGTADDDAAVTAYPADYEGGVNTLSGASINDGGAVASARRAQEVATENPGAATLNAVDAWGAVTVARSEERRLGKEWVRTVRSGGVAKP